VRQLSDDRDITALQNVFIRVSSAERIIRPALLKRTLAMTNLAHKIERALEILNPAGLVPHPANDNRERADFAAYLDASRADAGAAYQAAGAKLWWLP
jgi:hypothetical protein